VHTKRTLSKHRYLFKLHLITALSIVVWGVNNNKWTWVLLYRLVDFYDVLFFFCILSLNYYGTGKKTRQKFKLLCHIQISSSLVSLSCNFLYSRDIWNSQSWTISLILQGTNTTPRVISTPTTVLGLHNGYRVFLGVKLPGRGIDHPPSSRPRLGKE
jgi:hypothetical protein